MANLEFDFPSLVSEPLCVADFLVAGAIMPLGQSPWTSRRVGYVTGGRFEGPRLSGEILPGGGNWSTTGEIAPGEVAGTFDARAIWRTDDDAMIYVTYTGRSVVSDAVSAAFRDPARADDVLASAYYIRIAPVFETAAPRYAWLNGVLAVGCGHRTSTGIRHSIFAIR
jgi:hypothetical protein